jgi:DNA polymerase III subunit alpha
MYLIFDTETTGLPRNYNAPITDVDNWPRCVQIAWQLHDDLGNCIEHKDYLIKPNGFSIPFQSEKIHGISTELATTNGEELEKVLEEFKAVLDKAKFVVGQNVSFDINVMGCEFYRLSKESKLTQLPVLDTCTETTAELCQLPGGRGGKFKLPTLTELHKHLFDVPFNEAHNATADVEATTRCFFELLRTDVFSPKELQQEPEYLKRFKEANPQPISTIGLTHINLAEESEKLKKAAQPQEQPSITKQEIKDNVELLEDVAFSHLHNHTQFSILQATTEVDVLIKKAAEYNMPAVALTDSGNMMAAFQFVDAGFKHNKSIKSKIADLENQLDNTDADEERFAQIAKLKKQLVKPIVGCEFFINQNRNNKTLKDNGYQVPLLAKNKNGYHHLAKLSSIAYTQGFYYVPRIDREILEHYKADLIALTGGIYGEIPTKILNEGLEKAEEAFVWWHQQFGDDFYVELVRHNTQENEIVNEQLLKFAQKYGVKIIASNNTYYIDKADAQAHDILLCVKDGEKKSTPIGKGRGFRYGFPNNEFYFKSPQEMKELFNDLPEAIANTNEVVNKIEEYSLAREVLLPRFDIPDEFKDPQDDVDPTLKNGENNYLRHLTYEGAKKRYGEITLEIQERLDFELETIRKTGYPGYFLIVQDFCDAARKMNVSVGPGRGSAAGSAVAYCTGITNVDPIKYDLLFERFLNPDRVSLPDIDIDFDDEGRGRVIQYVIDKYGANQVAQIITYGTMAAKSSIRDAGRVLDLPLSDTDRIAKLVPDLMKLNKLFAIPNEELPEKLNGDQVPLAKELKQLKESNNGIEGEVVRQATVLEGSVRNTGIHACGVIITPSDITNFVPVALAKDSDMFCTQFDNGVVESAGLLKMDFLGLKTLTLIKDTLKIIKARLGTDIDIETIPMDDEKTYQLFQRGETVGIFQYESPGMQKHLKGLKPTVFADLIAMNALYRPGPLEYIPSFIKRKHGEEPIEYDLEACKEYLEETYGITVYQEQVMLLSQSLANFTKGEADVLRKAMGKKQKDVLDKMKPKFIQQASEKGHAADKLEKIWKDWEAFAAYAFNKSHSTCYALIAYQTAYLKAHYPAEYMASVLSNNMSDIKQVSFFMEECRRMGVKVLGPDVNESYHKFAVNKEGAVRFGMGAIKGVGENAVKSIVEERKVNGNYNSVSDFIQRIDLRSANKKTLEGLVLAGAFDSFGIYRSQYFANETSNSFIEQLIKFGNAVKSQNDAPPDLFGGTVTIEMNEPTPPNVEKWPTLVKLSKEKEVVGMYISGHPLDDYKLELKSFCKHNLKLLNEDLSRFLHLETSVAGIVIDFESRIDKRGNEFGIVTIEDFDDAYKFFLFSEDYLKYKHLFQVGNSLFVKGKVQQKKWGKSPSEVEFKIYSIELLRDLREKLAKNIELTIDLTDINEHLVGGLHNTIAAHKGKYPLKISVVDGLNKLKIDTVSQLNSVDLSNEFIHEIEELRVVEYTIN